MPDILSAVLASMPDGRVVRTVVGRRWTAAVVDVGGVRRCGLAASWRLAEEEGREPPVIEGTAARDLALELRLVRGLRASLAVATINGALSPAPGSWDEEKVEEVIRRRGEGKSVALVGHFPFVDELRPRVGSLVVVEERPRPGDFPASAAPDILPRAEVVVITGMAFVNQTLDGLLRLCSPEAHVILAGPSTPLSPVLFEHGVRELCGAMVKDVDAVLHAVAKGESFHGVHQAGVQLVTLSADRSH